MRNIKLRLAVRSALAAGALATVAAVPVAFAQDEAAADLERVQVTGTRILRTDVEGALPITVIDRDQIERSGYQSVSDLLRSTTFNSFGSYRPQSGSSFQGLNIINLRGLGASRTLVLVDGRRLAMAPQSGAVQDLNSIPLGAVERIEILSDGASAIYGSDAIGGVVNVITRRDFNGAELSISHGQVSVPRDGGDRDSGSAVFGSSTADTRVMGGVSWNKREIVFERDMPWVEPGSSLYGNNWADTGFSTGFDGIPGACNEPNFFVREISGADRCQYNFNATNANEASDNLESIFLKADQRINDNWSVFANASVARTRSFGRYAPAPDSNLFYGLPTPVDSFNNPTNPNAWFYDPNNPDAVAFDPDRAGENREVLIFHRFAAGGNRDGFVDNENLDFLIGAEGTFGMVDVDFGARRVRSKTYDIGYGYLAGTTAWTRVNEFNPGYGPDPSFQSDDPNAVAPTVFRPDLYRSGYDVVRPSTNPSDVLAATQITISRVAKFHIDELFASAAFDVVEIGGGMIQAFVGAEYRDEVYDDRYDSQSEAGLVGGSAGNSAGGGRDSKSAFFEVLFPVTSDFEVSLAGRHDDYSDYGSDFSPKVSFRWQPLADLVLRASYGEGFRAPPLDILTQETSFSADSVRDPVTCEVFTGDPTETCQINAFYIANPDLDSETSEQYAFGVAWQPTDWVNLALDYYNIKIDDRIRSFSAQNVITRELAGDPIPPGLGVTRNPQGVITRVDAGFGNEGTLETNGLDLNVRTNFNFGEFGMLASTLQVAKVLDYSIDGGRNLTNDPGTPDLRLNLQNAYTWGDFEFVYGLNLTGDQYERVVANDEGGVDRTGSIGSWVTHDFQVSYFAPWDGRFTLGVQNAFEKLPELKSAGTARDYNYDLYNGWGRIVYGRYTQRF